MKKKAEERDTHAKEEVAPLKAANYIPPKKEEPEEKHPKQIHFIEDRFFPKNPKFDEPDRY